MKPSPKAPGLETLLESVFGRTTAIRADRCVSCGKRADTFSTEIARKEYSISGLCQTCQDTVFRKETP